MSCDHQTTEAGVQPESLGLNGQISQIPGLSPIIKIINSLPEERTRGRRAGVLDSDSEYVKLAKQGGHKGLLWHEETFTPNAKSYKPPDWFSSASENDNTPCSPINSEEKKNPGAFKQLEPPFGTDNKSAWEREDSSSSSGKEKTDSVCCSETEKVQSPNQIHVTKFRRIVHDKRPAPVNMAKLLSFGYVEDEKPDATTDHHSPN